MKNFSKNFIYRQKEINNNKQWQEQLAKKT